ncbi:hypothetical protein CYMTET_18306 [Cymbomonas tetramitiformis]|uniref:Uncharacterized protein n=1 Tax=Cymbomonas tetramitiformis TaxID=36881 RepID=A0AAE0L6B0_9CHLO|nr:hypothetical protein CYMTET_18306 [Cymbomonas tetramitiformis]
MKAYMQRARKGNYHIQEKPRWEHFAEFLTEARKNTRSALGYLSTSLSAVESQDITQLSSDVFAEITHVLDGTTADSAVNEVLSDTEITHVLDGTTDGSAVNEVLPDTEDLSPLPMRSRLQRILATCKKSTHHQVLTGWGIELLLEGKPSLCFRKFAPDMPDYVEKAIIVRADLTYDVSAHGHGGLRDPSLGDGILGEKIERIAVLEVEVKVLTESMMAISDADHILCKDTLFRDPEVLTKIEENDKMRILFEDQEKFLKLKDKRSRVPVCVRS